jgi:hypothetical protein
MICSSERHFTRSLGPGLLCDECWARSRGHWSATAGTRHRQRQRRAAEHKTPRLVFDETPTAATARDEPPLEAA